ncbi:MAG TPA: hypothetical protein PKE66_11825 [Pyrinomonadaceae bacterium]|nr:hypothetical protein [Pyrinomonadaceae bacterium]
MKSFLLLLVLFAANVCEGQIDLDSKSIGNLVSIADLYSKGGNPSEYAASLDQLRTPRLNKLVDTIVALGKGDGTILDSKFLHRPGDDDLYFWYVIREIHYNRVSETRKPRPNLEVGQETIAKKIDSRWLLDNYYYRIRGGIASYFNEADLSKLDIKVDELGFKDKTERAIFFFNIMEALAGGRFMALMISGNEQKILTFTDRMPSFNGKPYYMFDEFDYPDFEWIGYEKVESYNQRHFERLYMTLFAHFEAESDFRDKRKAEEILRNSILSNRDYFKYSGMQKRLESLMKSRL